MNSKSVGELTEGLILAHLLTLGYAVLLPFGNNQRYDMVVDKGDGKLIKGQCKTARYQKGCLTFEVSSKNGFTHKRTSYVGQIDVFWVYAPYNKLFYEIPIEKLDSTSSQNLRVDPPKFGANISKVRWAQDYEI